jgi:hypothetical protein
MDLDHRGLSGSDQTISGNWWRTPLLSLRARLREREDQVFLVLALFIGALTGLTVVVFILLTERTGGAYALVGKGAVFAGIVLVP